MSERRERRLAGAIGVFHLLVTTNVVRFNHFTRDVLSDTTSTGTSSIRC
jgi:hypothetical protein